MSVLLDTHVLLWVAGDAKRLSKPAKSAIDRARGRGGLAIASITLWELASLAAARRILINGTLSNWLTALLDATGVGVLELSPAIAELSTLFGPGYPKDPADRIIGATAKQHGLPLITADTRVLDSKQLSCIW